jgi:hypothetical protein
MAFTYHYRVIHPDSEMRVVQVPGFGAIYKKLSEPLVRIEQTGLCDPAYISTIIANRGDPSVRVTINTLINGTYNNCYKSEAQCSAEMTIQGGLLRYYILWVQVV